MDNVGNKNNKVKYENLADRSDKDQIWDHHRKETDLVSVLYEQEQEFYRYFERMEDCSGRLEFSQLVNKDTGEMKIKLKSAHFCRVRHCPVCQWRKSLMWKARYWKALPEIQSKHPSGRWLFFTLTVRNCEITEVKNTIQNMHKAFIKLIQRKHFKTYNLGFIKTTEITRSKTGKAHPHFHVLLFMKSTYFSQGYMDNKSWGELWQDCLGVDYTPSVKIKAVRNKKTGEVVKMGEDGMEHAVAETLKYSVKPADMYADREWFHEMTRQVHKMRFVSTGGVLKDIFSEDVSEEEMLLLNDEEETDEDLNNNIFFNWHKKNSKYRRKIVE